MPHPRTIDLEGVRNGGAEQLLEALALVLCASPVLSPESRERVVAALGNAPAEPEDACTADAAALHVGRAVDDARARINNRHRLDQHARLKALQSFYRTVGDALGSDYREVSKRVRAMEIVDPSRK